MKTLLTLLLAALCAATSYGQTIKTLGYNTTNGQVVYSGTNTLTFMGSNGIVIDAGGGQTITVNVSGINFQTGPNGSVLNIPSDNPVELGGGVWDDPSVRSSLGFSANLNTFWKSTNSSDARSAVNLGATWLTNTNVTNFRSDIGLGETNNGIFATLRSTQVASSGIFTLTFGQTNTGFRGIGAGSSDFGYFRDAALIWYAANTNLTIQSGIAFSTTAAATTTRTNLGLPLAALTNTSDVTMMRALSGSTNTNHPFSGSVSVVGTNNTNTLVFSNGILQEVQ
jgi:hypothetical protein